MIRRGIAYGPELGPYETKTTHNRGLLFVSYQSDLSKGYSFVQKGIYCSLSVSLSSLKDSSWCIISLV